MSPPHSPSRTSRIPLMTPRLRRIRNSSAIPITSRSGVGEYEVDGLTSMCLPGAAHGIPAPRAGPGNAAAGPLPAAEYRSRRGHQAPGAAHRPAAGRPPARGGRAQAGPRPGQGRGGPRAAAGQGRADPAGGGRGRGGRRASRPRLLADPGGQRDRGARAHQPGPGAAVGGGGGGGRGRGAGALDALARAVPAAAAVAVVNNNAAALVLAATALRSGDADEIVVSRGELIEIGDRFRLPDLLTSTGARLREVGTTNRTALADYAEAVGPRTAFILKVHPSNFRIEGFTAAVGVRDLAGLGVPVVFDIGSGLLAPHPLLPGEPDAATALAEGVALVTASGDKLLGGPQAGLLLGRSDLVRRLVRHPLARALRVDKLTLAALEATLAGPVPPVASALAADPAAVARRAERAVALLREAGIEARVAAASAAAGGGG